MNYKSILKVSLLLILFFFRICPTYAMEENEGTPSPYLVSSMPSSSLLGEDSPLLIQQQGEREHELMRSHVLERGEPEEISHETQLRRRGLSDRMQAIRPPGPQQLPLKSALVVYGPRQLEYDHHEHESDQAMNNRPFLVLKSMEIFFDEQREPRRIAACCCSCLPTSLAWFMRIGAFGAVSLIKAGLSNGEFGNYFNYANGGVISWLVVGGAIVLDGPIGAIKFGELTEFALTKKRSTLRPVQAAEVGRTITEARLFKKSAIHKFLDLVLIPAAAGFALMPTALWLNLEQFFPGVAFGLAPVLMYYFGEPYYKMGKRVLGNLFADNFYIRDHQTRELRKALDASLYGLAEMIRKEKEDRAQEAVRRRISPKNMLVSKVWSILNERTRSFGKEGRIEELNDAETISAFSSLFTTVLAALDEPENTYEQNWNKTLATIIIKDKPFRDKMAEHSAHGLMAVNLIPGILMEKYALSTALQVAGVPPVTANTIGYVSAGVFSPKLVLESAFHQKTFKGIAHPRIPDPADTLVARRLLKAKAFIHAVFNAALFLLVCDLSLTGNSRSIFYLFLPFVAVRFLSLFYSVATDAYDNVVTRFQTKHRADPTLEQKRAKVYNFIERARQLVRYDLDDDAAVELSKVIFKGN